MERNDVRTHSHDRREDIERKLEDFQIRAAHCGLLSSGLGSVVVLYST
jgi:hypothetical protein